MPSHVLAYNYTRSGEQIAKNVTVTADGEKNLSVALGASETDKQVDIAIDVSELKSLFISCDVDVTVETNNGSSPADTLTIKAGKPLSWHEECGLTNPLGTDVTALFLTCTAAGTFELRALEDLTP